MRKRRLPRLSRGWKIAVNLTIAAVSSLLFWGALDYPLNSEVCNFRRAERINWVGPSDIQYVGDNYCVIGTYMDQVVIGTGAYNLDCWPRNRSGSTLVPADNKFVAVDVPEGTARAELTLELAFYYFPAASEPTSAGPTYAVREQAEQERGEWWGPAELWQDTYVFPGELQKEGGVLFRAEPKSRSAPGELGVWDDMPLFEVTDREMYSRAPRDNSARAQMTAVFYGGNGNELGRAALATPE